MHVHVFMAWFLMGRGMGQPSVQWNEVPPTWCAFTYPKSTLPEISMATLQCVLVPALPGMAWPFHLRTPIPGSEPGPEEAGNT